MTEFRQVWRTEVIHYAMRDGRLLDCCDDEVVQ